MHRAELMGLLNDSGVREKLEKCLAEHANATDSSKEATCAQRQPGEFEKEAHNWNPQRSVWNRSPKE